MDTVTWDQMLYLGEHTVGDHSEATQIGYIYALLDPLGQVCYIGSTIQSLPMRLNKHRSAMKSFARHPQLSTPLNRAVVDNGWDPDQMTIRVYRTVHWTGTNRDVLRREETAAIKLFRALGHKLLQRNTPFCDTEKQRNQMKRWRQEHPGYMAVACKEWRERRKRQALEQAEAESTQAVEISGV